MMLTRKGQRAFVRELSSTIARDITAAITAGKIPAEWDGHELRALLAMRHAQSAAMSLVLREKRSKRARDFNNVVICNNL